MIRLNLAATSGVLIVLVGCGGGDGRLADLASQVTQEQAQQNQRLADASKAIAQGSQQLVDADADARREVIKLQQELRQDQAAISQQRDVLEAERKAISRERRIDSAIGSGLVVFGFVLASLAPLILAGISLVGLWKEPTQEEEGDVLIEALANTFIVADVPRSLLPSDHPNLPPPQEASSTQG